MAEHVAQLTVTQLDDGTLRILGTVLRDGVMREIHYDAPSFMFDALMLAAEKEGALL